MLYFEDGTSAQTTINLLANSRTNVSIADTFPSSNGRRFGIIVDSLGVTPRPSWWSSARCIPMRVA